MINWHSKKTKIISTIIIIVLILTMTLPTILSIFNNIHNQFTNVTERSFY